MPRAGQTLKQQGRRYIHTGCFSRQLATDRYAAVPHKPCRIPRDNIGGRASTTTNVVLSCSTAVSTIAEAVTDHLATGRPVRATKLGRLLPNFRDFVLRPQPREVYIVDRAGCDDSA